MILPIPRGIIYHSIFYEIKLLLFSVFARLDNKKEVQNFENKFSKYMATKHCIAFPFARTAIYFTLKSRSFPEGTEIIMPPISIKGILDVVLDLKLKPIFVDIDPDTLCFDLGELKKSITNNTKAILITYLYGIVPNLDELIKTCNQNELFIIEDFSHNLNSTFNSKKLGTFGDVGIYSSSSIKTLDTIGGGLLITDNSKLFIVLRNYADSLKNPPRKVLIKKIFVNFYRNIATNRLVFALLTFPMLKILKKYFPEDIIKYSGTRSRKPIKNLSTEWFNKYTSFQAKIGSKTLDKVSALDEIRINNVSKIISNVDKLATPKGNGKGKNVYWQFAFYSDNARIDQEYLHANKIDTSTTSLVNISSLTLYPHQGITPNADKLYKTGLFIPSYHRLKDRDIYHIINVLNNLLKWQSQNSKVIVH